MDRQKKKREDENEGRVRGGGGKEGADGKRKTSGAGKSAFKKRKRFVKAIKKTSALSPASPLRWDEDVDLTHTGSGNLGNPYYRKASRDFNDGDHLQFLIRNMRAVRQFKSYYTSK